jgi:GNAT superfamily N-acetyltransferase
MSEPFEIRQLPSTGLTDSVIAEVYRLCDAAYECSTKPFFEQLAPGEHLLGFSGNVLLAHLMWITRWLQPEGSPLLRTVYIEMVATEPSAHRRGYATALLEHVVLLLGDFELAALCPANESLYARLGWRFWQGPLATRQDGRLIPTPEERVMVMPLPRTPPLDFGRALSIEWRPGEVW